MADVEIVIRTIDQTTKQTKNIDDTLKGLGMTVAKVSATVVAGGIALKKAMEFGEQGAQVLQTAESFDFLIAKIGANKNLLEEYNKISGGTIDQMSLMSSTATLLAGTEDALAREMANMSPAILEAAKAANKLNPALGSTDFLYRSLMTGIKRGSPLIIDNAGVTLKVSEAYEKYAQTLGKTADELDSTEQKLALLYATADAGQIIIDQVGGSTESAADSFARMHATTKNYVDMLKADAAPALAELADKISEVVLAQMAIRELQERGRVTGTGGFAIDLDTGEVLAGADAIRILAEEQEKEAAALAKINTEMGPVDEKLRQYYEITGDAAEATGELSDELKILQDDALKAVQDAISGKLGDSMDKYKEKSKDLEEDTADLQKQLLELSESGFGSLQGHTLSLLNQLGNLGSQGLDLTSDKADDLFDSLFALAAGAQGPISQKVSGLLSELQDLGNKGVGLTNEKSQALLGELKDLVANGFSPTSDEVITLTDKINDNITALEDEKKALNDMTNELIFQNMSMGLSAAAQLELGRALGIVDERTYAVSKASLDLHEKYDRLDGKLDGVIEDTHGYADEAVNLRDRVNELDDKNIDITVDNLGWYTGAVGEFKNEWNSITDKNVVLTIEELWDQRFYNADYYRQHQHGGFGSIGQMALVGESGPELVKFNQPGNVIPNNELGDAMGVTIENLYISISEPGMDFLETIEDGLSQRIGK